MQKQPPLNSLVVVGQIGAPHGIRGALKFRSFTTPDDNIFQYKPWWIKPRGAAEAFPHVCQKADPSSKGWIITLKEVTDRNQAELYTLSEIFVSRDLLPSLPVGEYYWSQLEGLHVFTTLNVELGIVDRLHETGSNDVLVVRGEREHWIPYLVGSIVLEVDLKAGKIVVDWDPEF